jgi:hypothetical protein
MERPTGVWQARDMAGFRVTYATMSADDATLNAAYDAAIETVRGEFGAQHPLWIGDDERYGEAFTTVSPLDTSVVIGHFTLADGNDIDDVVDEARRATRSGRRRRGRNAATSSIAPPT